MAYEKKREYDRAIADFSAALKIDPQDANALANRAGVHEKTGKLNDALNDLNKAIELQPGEGSLWNARCWIRAIVEHAAACTRGLQRGHSPGPTDGGAI